MVIDAAIKYGPLTIALVSLVAWFAWKYLKKEPCRLEDILIVFMSGASMPTAVLLICSGFNKELLSKVSDAGIYMGLAGVALLYVGVRNLRDTFKSKI